jgi:glycogen synthase kinase 3 beta
MRILGTPSKNDISFMNKSYMDFKFPQVPKINWNDILKFRRKYTFKNNDSLNDENVPNDAINLISLFLQYNPNKRIKLIDALSHPFFEELRNKKNVVLPDGTNFEIPNDLFIFAPEELINCSEKTKKYFEKK